MFLSDSELVKLLSGPSPPVTGVSLDAPYAKDSLVQAASLDLTIGSVLLPGQKADRPGGVDKPIVDDHVLKSGETAVVVTKETLAFPPNLGAFGFPPSSLSSKGLLMTNPGHVDPGFSGRLRFTVINMAKDELTLTGGARIVTLLLFQLDPASHADWRKRTGLSKAASPTERQVNRLSADFLDVSQRAKTAAAGAERTTRAMGLGVPVLVALVAIIGTFLTTRAATNDKINALEKDTAVLKADQERQKLDQRLTAVEGKVQVKTAAKQKAGGGG